MLDATNVVRSARGRAVLSRRPWKGPAEVPAETDLTSFRPQDVPESASDFPNLWYQSQWSSMRAFSLPSFGEGRIRVNLEGRERDGIVSKDDYAATCEALIRLLHETTDPRTGRSVVQDVNWVRRDDPFDPLGPDGDLLVEWAPQLDAFDHPTLGTIGPFPLMRTGEHSNRGFALVTGPGVQPGRTSAQPATTLPDMILSLAADEPDAVLGGHRGT